MNGDGKADIVVCAVNEFRNTQVSPPQTAGRAYLFDGATRELLRELRSPNENVNGDGLGDVAVGSWNDGGANIYDGATGSLLHTLRVPGNPSELVGWVVNRLADVDGDGRDDVVVAGFQGYDQGQIPAEAYVFSGASGELLATLPGHSDYGAAVQWLGCPT